MQLAIEKVRLKDINVIKINAPTEMWMRMHRLIDALCESGQLDDVINSTQCCSLKVKSQVFLFERYFLLSVLAERYPNLEIEFLTVTLKRSETLTSIRERIVRQIILESIPSLDSVHAFSFEKANSTQRRLSRKGYAHVLGCKPNSLNVYDRLYANRRLQTPPETDIEPLNPEEILNEHRVSPLPTNLAQGSSDEA